MYKAKDILKSDLNEYELLDRAQYLEEMLFFEEATSVDGDKEFEDDLHLNLKELINEFLVNNCYKILNILNEYKILKEE